jgi:trehalose-6-phosphate synthase
MCWLHQITKTSCPTVWVHDYHLLLLPGMIRERIPDAKIGLFVHAPFPSSEIFRCLPSMFLMSLKTIDPAIDHGIN